MGPRTHKAEPPHGPHPLQPHLASAKSHLLNLQTEAIAAPSSMKQPPSQITPSHCPPYLIKSPKTNTATSPIKPPQIASVCNLKLKTQTNTPPKPINHNKLQQTQDPQPTTGPPHLSESSSTIHHSTPQPSFNHQSPHLETQATIQVAQHNIKPQAVVTTLPPPLRSSPITAMTKPA